MDALVLDDRCRVISADDAAAAPLHADGRCPWLKDVLLGHASQRGDVMADEVTVGVVLLAECDRRIAAEVLVGKARAGESHPVPIVDGPVSVEQVVVEDLRPLLPALPQIAAREKTSNGVAG